MASLGGGEKPRETHATKQEGLGSGPKRPGSKPLSTGWGPKVVGQKLEPQKRKMEGKWDERWNIWWVYFLFLETKSCLHAVSFLIVRLSHLLFGNGFRVGALGCSFRNFGLEPWFFVGKSCFACFPNVKNP